MDGPLPFECDAPVDDVEVWLTTANGLPACLLVSALPIFDEAGAWLGARGVCRDVTEARQRDAQLAGARDRERLQGEIIDSIRNQIDPDKMLGVAAESVARAMEARQCAIFRAAPGGELELAVSSSGRVEGTMSLSAAMLGAAMQKALAGNEPAPVDLVAGGQRVLAVPSHYRSALNGVICVCPH